MQFIHTCTVKIKIILKKLFLINTERSVHHQLLYVQPVLFLLFIIKGCSIDTILYDFISILFIVN